MIVANRLVAFSSFLALRNAHVWLDQKLHCVRSANSTEFFLKGYFCASERCCYTSESRVGEWTLIEKSIVLRFRL